METIDYLKEAIVLHIITTLEVQFEKTDPLFVLRPEFFDLLQHSLDYVTIEIVYVLEMPVFLLKIHSNDDN